MSSVLQDVRYTVRTLARRPGLTAGVVASLALALAANVFVAGVVDALLLRPVPVRDAGSLVDLHARARDGSSFHSFSYPAYTDLRDASTALEAVSAYSLAPVAWSTGDEAELATGMVVSENYFSMLGVRPAAGRLFRPGEGGAADGEAEVVLSDRLWRTGFGRDPAVIGRTLEVNGRDLTVIGVAPEGFHGTFNGLAPALWLPVRMAAALHLGEPLDGRGQVWLELVGRLAPGRTVEQARASLEPFETRMRERYPESGEYLGIDVVPASPVPGIARKAIEGFLAVLFALTGLLLLLACLNVAGLLVARATERSREIAIRLALGSGRRLVRQLLVESLVLFLLAASFGVAVARLLLALAPRLLAPVQQALPIEVRLDLRLDHRVLAYTLLVALGTGLLFGLAPVIQAARADLVPELKGETASGDRRKHRLRRLLVVGQTAVSLLLLVLAGLLVRGLARSGSIDPGFNPRGVHVLSLDVSRNGYGEADGRAFYRRLTRRVDGLPGVVSAALANHVVLGTEHGGTGVDVPGIEPPGDDDAFAADQLVVSPGYFRTLEIPLVEGRPFEPSDGEGAPQVAVVSEAFARRFWPGGDAVGKTFYDGPVAEGRAIRVVGVARQGKYRSLAEAPRLFVYRPFRQEYRPGMTLHVRIEGDPTPTLQAIRGVVRGMDDGLPLVSVMPLARYIRISTLPQRLAASLAATLGVLGLLLVAVGIYGLVAYSASRRRREMGIRLAVGARPAEVRRLVLRQGLGLAIAGAALGLGPALLAGRALSSLLFGVSPADPVTLVGVTALLLAVSVAASLQPARSASRQDPATTLRSS
jgi:predicted permease